MISLNGKTASSKDNFKKKKKHQYTISEILSLLIGVKVKSSLKNCTDCRVVDVSFFQKKFKQKLHMLFNTIKKMYLSDIQRTSNEKHKVTEQLEI